jgi:hypothetical protein
MKQLKYLLVLFLLILTVFTSCEKNEENDKIEPSDKLEQFGILGKWRLQSLTINGITDMIVHYDTIGFTTGIESNDLMGEFRSVGAGYETNGSFELNNENNTIIFDNNNTQKLYEFLISGNYMTFKYNEDSIEYIEDWSKVE